MSCEEQTEEFVPQKRSRRARRKKRHRRLASTGSDSQKVSEFSDGDDLSSCISRTLTSEDGHTSENELSSASAEHQLLFGSPAYWDYKRAQLKVMVADRDKRKQSVTPIQPSLPLDEEKAETQKFTLPDLFLDHETFLVAGDSGSRGACLMTNVAPFVDLNFAVTCADLNIIPSSIPLKQGQDVTSQLRFRAPPRCIPGPKTLSVTVSGFNVEPCTFSVRGLIVSEAVDSVTLSESPCMLSHGKPKNNLFLEFNTSVQNAPLRVTLDSSQLVITPSQFLVAPDSTRVGPFSLECQPEAESGRQTLTVMCEPISTTPTNLRQNPTKLEVPNVFCYRPISTVKFEPMPDKLIPGTTVKARIVVDSAPVRDTILTLHCEPALTLSTTRLRLSKNSTKTEVVFIQVSEEAKAKTYACSVGFTSFLNAKEKRVFLHIPLTIHHPSRFCSDLSESMRFEDADTSSEVESMSYVSTSSKFSFRSTNSPKEPLRHNFNRDDVSLEQLKHLLKDLLARKDKLPGQKHRRERTRIKSRIKAIKDRIEAMESPTDVTAPSTPSEGSPKEKRDPHRRPVRPGRRIQAKRDPAFQRFEQPNTTAFERRRNSVPTLNLTESEDSDYLPRSEAFITRKRKPSKPPRLVKSPGVNLSPQVFSEMMDFPITKWNTEHVGCWLHSLGMGYRKYVRLFQTEGLQGKHLIDLTAKNLASMGILMYNHRERILEEIKKLTLKLEPNVTHTKLKNVTSGPSDPPSDPHSRLFDLTTNSPPAEIKKQIHVLRESLKKKKGRRKKQARLRTVQTIQKLEMLLQNVEKSPTPPHETPLSYTPQPVQTSDSEVFRKLSKEHAFKTPKTNETFKLQDSATKRSEESAFSSIKRDYHSNIQSNSAFTPYQDDEVSVSSATLSELDDTEEFEMNLQRHIQDETASVYSDSSRFDDDSYSVAPYEEDDDSSDGIPEGITYGTPGYWAFKRRQLQEMAQKRKQRLQAQAQKSMKRKSKNSLDQLLRRHQARLKHLTKQKSQYMGKHHKKHRTKIVKQVQKRIHQLQEAKRLRSRRQAKQRDAEKTASVSLSRSNEPSLTPERLLDDTEDLSSSIPSLPEEVSPNRSPPSDSSPVPPPTFDHLISPSSRELHRKVRRASTTSVSSATEYASSDYWNTRYRTKTQPDEWYEGFNTLKPFLKKHIQKTFLCLDLGCGDSSIQDSLREEGYEIMALDISTVILERLASSKREMVCADAFRLPFLNGMFDVILDKGTLDSISCDKSRSLNPFFQEVQRILRPNGKYICITPWNAAKRMPQLNQLGCRIEHEVLPMSLQTLATQKFNQLSDHPRFGRDKDTLMAMSFRQAAECLKTLDTEAEKTKPPGKSCVLHCFTCTKLRYHASAV